MAETPRAPMNAENCSANCCLVGSAGLLTITFYLKPSAPATMQRCGWFTTEYLTPLAYSISYPLGRDRYWMKLQPHWGRAYRDERKAPSRASSIDFNEAPAIFLASMFSDPPRIGTRLADPKKNPAARPAMFPRFPTASFEKLRGASSALR